MNSFIRNTAMALTLSCAAGLVSAATIDDFDLSTFDFEVIEYDSGSHPAGLAGDATAFGTSNGISWGISPTHLWSERLVTDNSFVYSALPNPTDNLHVGSDYVITFAETVTSLLVAISNDSITDALNFGIVPTDISGATVSGTQVTLDHRSGGLILFENINSLTITNLNNNGINDGYDIAFHANPTVAAIPLPAGLWLFVSGLVGLFGYKNVTRKKI